jgi:hypothetical protein
MMVNFDHISKGVIWLEGMLVVTIKIDVCQINA